MATSSSDSETPALHTGRRPDPTATWIAAPIHQTTPYRFKSAAREHDGMPSRLPVRGLRRRRA